MIKKQILKNNVTLVTQQVSQAKTVAIGFYFDVGSRYETKNFRGISHFCEHLLFKGTKDYSRKDIAGSFDRMGGLVNAFTERDDVCMYCVIPWSDKNFSKALDIFCSMTEDCIFPEDEMEKERDVVENEIGSVEDDCDESSLDALAGTVWDGSGLSWTITGDIQDVENLDRSKVLSWYDEYFAKGKLTVYIAGNFDHDYAVEKIQALKNHKTSNGFPKENFVWKSGNRFVKSKFNQNQVYVNYPLPNYLDEKSYWAMCVFNSIFGDTMGSRLFETLREKNGLCYAVYSFYSFYENNGIWSACASCEKSNVEKVLSLMTREIELVLEKGIDDSELDDAKGHLCGEEIMGECDMEYVMRRLQKFHSLGLPFYETSDILASIRRVQKNDIMELLEEIFKPESKAVLVYGKKKPSSIK